MSGGPKGLCLAFSILLTAITPWLGNHTPAQEASSATAGWPIGDFSRVDQNGSPFTKQSLDGRWTPFVLGDSRCGDACAAALSATTGLLSRIAGIYAVQTTQVVLLSLQSDNTAADMRRLLDPYGAGYFGVTRPSQELAGLADDLGG